MYGESNDIVLKLDVVETLKKMNQCFPKNQECYDEQFIFRIMRAIFTKEELNDSRSGMLRTLDFSKRLFLKGMKNCFS